MPDQGSSSVFNLSFSSTGGSLIELLRTYCMMGVSTLKYLGLHFPVNARKKQMQNTVLSLETILLLQTKIRNIWINR
uniref:Uncharacterized protein n=1 Tax=Anguilla anguilla TaxID=7936 RepID=A0A0E9XD06_ANGAN